MTTVPSRLRAAILVFATLSSTAHAQNIPPAITMISADANDGGTDRTPVVAAAKPGTSSEAKPLLGRWLAIDTLSNSERYRDTFVKGGAVLWANAQQRSLIVGKFKFDEEGRYTIGFRASSGHYFNWSFSSYTGESVLPRASSAAYHASTYTPAQFLEIEEAIFVDPTDYATLLALKSNGAPLYFRELYFSASPSSRLRSSSVPLASSAAMAARLQPSTRTATSPARGLRSIVQSIFSSTR